MNRQRRPASHLRLSINAIKVLLALYGMPVLAVTILAALAGSSTILAPDPPANQANLCDIFREHPEWYDHAKRSEERWGTPVATQMAFVRQESSFRSHVRPPRTRLFGVLPWSRPSSAYGYAQAQDPAWNEYMEDAGSILAQRTQIRHALDFIGWYNRRTLERVGIPLSHPEHLYLAYHEGRTGFKRGSYRQKPTVQRIAEKVAERTWRYDAQLKQCEAEFQCRRFYEIGPFC